MSNLTMRQRKALGLIGDGAKIQAALSDPRWITVGNADDEVRIYLGSDRRIIMWREDYGINVGALQGNRTVWDFVDSQSFRDAEQAAFDCYQALCLLDDVRVIPSPKPSLDGVRRKIRRQLVRAVCEWTLVAVGYVLGAGLVILALLSWMMLGLL